MASVRASTVSEISRRALPWLVPLLIVAAWQILVVIEVVPRRLFPGPTEVAQALADLAATGQLWRHLGASLHRALIGLLVGGGLGLALGILNGLTRTGERLLDTSFQMARTVPHLALIPLAILWFGIGEPSKLFLISLGTFFPMYLNTFHGIRSVDAKLIEAARVYGLADEKSAA